MDQNTLVIVAADKGGVGKTTVSRLLIDYIETQKLADLKLYDTEFPRGSLKRFYPQAEIVDLENIRDQMKIIDGISFNNNVTIIDVCAGLLSPTLKMFSKIGLLEAVRAGQLNLVILHVLGASISSLSEITETIQIIQGAKYYLVKNHINDGAFFDWDPNITAALSMAPMIEIPRLEEMAGEYIDQAGTSYSQYINGVGGSFVLKGFTRDWLKAVYTEFDRVKMKELLLRG